MSVYAYSTVPLLDDVRLCAVAAPERDRSQSPSSLDYHSSHAQLGTPLSPTFYKQVTYVIFKLTFHS